MQANITPHLWYSKDAEGAAKLYTSIFPDSRIDRVWTMAADTPSGPKGSVKVVHFTLMGQQFMGLTAGELDPFNHSVSFMVACDAQDEIDRYTDALLEGGGEQEPCGWVRDRYGLAWQIVPRMLNDWMADADEAKAKRTAEAMLKMKRLDIAKLKAAYDGR